MKYFKQEDKKSREYGGKLGQTLHKTLTGETVKKHYFTSAQDIINRAKQNVKQNVIQNNIPE